MPIFRTNGPKIPAQLLHAQEEGRVVFFCGAGVSAPAGLPLFKDLVDNLYTQLGTSREPTEEQEYEHGKYDHVVGLLEQRHIGGRDAVRKKLPGILTPNLRKKDALTMHSALLQLAMDRSGMVRIVTTNYDHLFKKALKKQKRSVPEFSAPSLPIPKPSQWNGIVYLHGLLPPDDDPSALSRLVLSSGDFGLAYLTECWAARFVSEVFRNYHVCFVGYSLNDPILRYMVDAIAADKLRGEDMFTEFYAFAGFKDDHEKKKVIKQWEAKQVVPITYPIESSVKETQKHAELYETFKNWAEVYRDGLSGKKRIIAQYAAAPPLTSLATNHESDEFLWVITDPDAARYFSEMDPVPSLSWLDFFSKPQFNTHDLNRFGFCLTPQADKLKSDFSMLERPAPHTKFTMKMFGKSQNSWDEIMDALANWLLRHLNDPRLAIWISEEGGRLSQEFAWLLRDELALKKPKCQKIDDIMRTIWDLFLAGRIGSYTTNDGSLFFILEQIELYGLNPGLKRSFLDALTPCVIPSLNKPTQDLFTIEPSSGTTIKDQIHWDFGLKTRDARALLRVYGYLRDDGKISIKENLAKMLVELLVDITRLLRDLFELREYFGDIDSKDDRSYFEYASIEEHLQNDYGSFGKWTILIELAREAWIAASKLDPCLARRIAEEWWNTPYPLFKRMAFFTAKYSDIIPYSLSINWLLSEDAYWLWDGHTKREVMRFLSSLKPDMDKKLLDELENNILAGPKRETFKKELTDKEWKYIFDKKVWLRLTKLNETGILLNETAKEKLKILADSHPEFKLYKDQQEEFPIWISSDAEISLPQVVLPESCKDLAESLKNYSNIENKILFKENWEQRCQEDFQTTFCALRLLSEEKLWLVELWQIALDAWIISGNASIENFLKLTPILKKASDSTLRKLALPISYWLEALAKQFQPDNSNIQEFFSLCERIIDLKIEYNDTDISNLLNQAFNHPTGKIVLALFGSLSKNELEENSGLKDPYKRIFAKVCDVSVSEYALGRLILCLKPVYLSRLDPDWTNEYLLPLFSWAKDREARFAWQGFLYSPRLYYPFLASIKDSLLETVNHYTELGQAARNYAALMTYISLESQDIFTEDELRRLFNAMPEKGLVESVHTVRLDFESIQNQKQVTYWKNRVTPFFDKIWPKDKNRLTSKLIRQAALLCVSAGDNFPSALKLFEYWLKPIQSLEDAPFPLSILAKSELCKKFPNESLIFLDKIIDKESNFHDKASLQDCLKQIVAQNSELKNADAYRCLAALI